MANGLRKANRFEKGSGCYKCRVCERQTRATGGDNDGIQLCYECYEVAMNWYGIAANNSKERFVLASSARVATGKGMQGLSEREFKPEGHVRVRYIKKAEHVFDIIADVPFDYGENGKGTKRTTVDKGIGTQAAADATATQLQRQHPDWRWVKAVKRVVEL